MTVPVPLWLLIVHAAVTALLAILLWSLKDRRDPTFRIDTDADLPDLVRSFAGLTHGDLIEGNSAELVENGVFFDRLVADIAAAQRSVHLETFLWKKGHVGERVARALAERAAAGIEVRVLVDANGSREIGEDTERALKDAGCKFAWYHPRKLRVLGRLNNRDHRKLAVIDGRIGYAGGHCIVDTWDGEAQDKKHFRDISVRLSGPVVHSLQSTFSENWVASTGELFVGDDVFPPLAPTGATTVHVARMRPSGSASDVKILHQLVICCARRHVLIQNPYFLPDPEAIDLLAKAVARGVDVRVMTPSPAASDMPIVQHAAHHNYAALLAAGVRVFEYQKTLLHQKVITVDGQWCAIGSSNFDDRSFEINDEITLGYYAADLAAELEAIFARDARDCIELDPRSWSKRGIRHRLLDRVLYLFNEQL
jgi:cardiolipin synthase A/B